MLFIKQLQQCDISQKNTYPFTENKEGEIPPLRIIGMTLRSE